MSVIRGPWPDAAPSGSKLERELRASLKRLNAEFDQKFPAAEAAESDVVPVSDALARVSPAFTLQIASFAEAREIAKILCATEFVPQSYRNKPDAALAAIMMGGELGVGPMQALQGIAVINGRPTIWGDLALALVQIHPEFVSHTEWYDANTRTCHCTLKRKGKPDVTGEFSWDDAVRADLHTKDTYKKYPKRMLKMRARAWALRDQFSDALRGLAIREEVLDYDHVSGRVQVANDAPIDPREMRAEVVEPKAALPPTAASVQTLPAQPQPQPVAAAPVPLATVLQALPVVQQLTGADFVVPNGKNKNKKMGELRDDQLRWYADECKDGAIKGAAGEVRAQRLAAGTWTLEVPAGYAVATAAAKRAQQAAEANGLDYDPATGEVLQ